MTQVSAACCNTLAIILASSCLSGGLISLPSVGLERFNVEGVVDFSDSRLCVKRRVDETEVRLHYSNRRSSCRCSQMMCFGEFFKYDLFLEEEHRLEQCVLVTWTNSA